MLVFKEGVVDFGVGYQGFVGVGVVVGVLYKDIVDIGDFECLLGVLFYYQDGNVGVGDFDDVFE